jgi:glycosyltransferase involved in cell wall biosynthesis
VVIPSYHSGALLVPTVESVLRHAPPGSVVLVVIDGSTDGSGMGACDLAAKNPALRVFCSERNEGKGAATLRALEVAHEMGCSHAAVFDSNGQHAAEDLPAFFDAARWRRFHVCGVNAPPIPLPVQAWRHRRQITRARESRLRLRLSAIETTAAHYLTL